MAEVEEILSEQLATRVQIQMNKKRGRVIIEFGSADDLERIVSEIVGFGSGALARLSLADGALDGPRPTVRMTVTQVGQRHAGRVGAHRQQARLGHAGGHVDLQHPRDAVAHRRCSRPW